MNSFEMTRRKLFGGTLVGAGALLSTVGWQGLAAQIQQKGVASLKGFPKQSKGLAEAVSFPLIEALQGRRSRRFALGAEIPDGPLKYKSKQAPKPLGDIEELTLLTAMAGNTGWSHLIPHNKYYSPNIPNYAGAAGGRTFPSCAGFHTSELFFTNDSGTYFLPTKDMPSVLRDQDLDLKGYFDVHKKRIVKIDDKRLNFPKSPEHVEPHNNWCANVPGSTLIIPVANLAQHYLMDLCYLVQSGGGLYDDINDRPIPGLEKFSALIDIGASYPLSLAEQNCVSEVVVELSTSCYAGALMLQAQGLGGWMYNGINPFSILGANGDADVRGLKFSYETDDRWSTPNVTGLPGIFEGTCLPNYDNMRDAVEAVVARKFGPGGPFSEATPGPYKDNAGVRGAGASMSEQFIDCVTHLAQYTYDTFGRCPGNASSMFTMMYLQAHNLDLGFYNRHFSEDAYLRTHAEHENNW